MTVYRSIENYAVREYGLCEIHFTMPEIEKKQTDILTSAERKRLESYLLNNQNSANIAILLSLFTKLRVGELCGLKWEDIELFIERLKKHTDVQNLTREMFLELIEYITLNAYVEGQPREIYINYKLLDEPLLDKKSLF